MKHNVFELLILMLLLASCHTEGRKEIAVSEKRITVSLENASVLEPIKCLNEMVLDENSEFFPGMIHKMQYVNDTIYVLDIHKSPGLYAYDRNGKFLYAYEKVGQGPEEFMSLADFQLSDTAIWLLDNFGEKILELNKKGNYVSAFPINNLAFSFAILPDGNVYFDTGNAVFTDKSKLLFKRGEELISVMMVPEELENITISPTNTLIGKGSGVLYLPPMENVVYEYNEGEMVNTYRFDFGLDWPNKKFLFQNKKMHPLMLLRHIVDSSYIYEMNFLSDGDILLLNFMKDDSFYLFFYNMKTDKHKLYIDTNKEFYRPLSLSGDKFYVVKETDSFIVREYCFDPLTLDIIQ